MRWPPFKHVIFDCDSTLTTVEGIDVLADVAQKKAEVEALTNAAMNGEVDLGDIYGKRLDAIGPTRHQIHAITQAYKNNIVEDTQAVIDALIYLKHALYIISGGLLEPVLSFGISLGIPADSIRAVGVTYNKLSGNWWDNTPQAGNAVQFSDYRKGPLTISSGKAKIVRQLTADFSGEKILLVGDGASDLAAAEAVDLFVGYGGVVERKLVVDSAETFIHTPSLAPLLALIVGPAGLAALANTPHTAIAEKAHKLIKKGAISFQNEQRKQKFQRAYQAVYPRANGSTP